MVIQDQSSSEFAQVTRGTASHDAQTPCGSPSRAINDDATRPRAHTSGDTFLSIDIETARKVAPLARIKVEDDRLPELAENFNAILGFIEQLNEVDVDGVEPMTSVTPMALPRRADSVTDGSKPEQVHKNAPDAREGFFVVPKVVE